MRACYAVLRCALGGLPPRCRLRHACAAGSVPTVPPRRPSLLLPGPPGMLSSYRPWRPAPALSAEQRTEAEGGGCRSCFAIFVAAFTTVALVTLAVVLNPGSRFGRRWRRLGGDGGGDGDLRGLGVGEDGEGGDGGGLEGFDTRRYSAHMSEEELAAAAAAEADRMRRARRRQLQQEGLSLAPYDSVRATVREQLLPAGAQPSAPLAATPPKRRLAPGGGSPSRSPDGIEMAARGPQRPRRPVSHC